MTAFGHAIKLFINFSIFDNVDPIEVDVEKKEFSKPICSNEVEGSGFVMSHTVLAVF